MRHRSAAPRVACVGIVTLDHIVGVDGPRPAHAGAAFRTIFHGVDDDVRAGDAGTEGVVDADSELPPIGSV